MNLWLPFLPSPVKPTVLGKGTNDRVAGFNADDAHRLAVEENCKAGVSGKALFSAA